jgi:hypothetical protein
MESTTPVDITLSIFGGRSTSNDDQTLNVTKCPCKDYLKPDQLNDDDTCKSCIGVDIMQYIEAFINKQDAIDETKITDNIVMNKLATITECKDEKCIIDSSVVKNLVPSSVISTLMNMMKPCGPKDTTEWLSNNQIDAVLSDLIDEYSELMTFKTTMMDFKIQHHTLSDLSLLISLLDDGRQCIACVINTDKYSSCTGNGSCGVHWVCVFIDCRKNSDTDWSIEYFDSVGDPPPREIVSWQEDVKRTIDAYRAKKEHRGTSQIENNNVKHQHHGTECGCFCLYFIRSRTEDIPFSRFLNKRIPDSSMISFRKFIFA